MILETPEKIHRDISDMLSHGMTYVEALCEYAEQKNMDIELIAGIIKKSPIFYEKIKEEAIARNVVKFEDEADSLDKFFE